jgi:site-specific DNA recombinase
MPGSDWLAADSDAKRRIHEFANLNCHLDGATLVPQIRKPFDDLAEGLLSEKKGEKIRSFDRLRCGPANTP